MDKSDQLDQLGTALAKAQAELRPALENAQNPHFRNSYADLTSVWDACREALTRNGLSVVQTFEPTDGSLLKLSTTLLHASGQWISGTSSFPVGKPDAQGYASASTYARRYGLAAIVGICTADDDGNAASGQQQDRGRRSQQREPAPTQQRQEPRPPQPQRPPAASESSGDRKAQSPPPPAPEPWDKELRRPEAGGPKLLPENEVAVALQEKRQRIVTLLEPAKKAGMDPGKLDIAGRWAQSSELTTEKADSFIRSLERHIEDAKGPVS